MVLFLAVNDLARRTPWAHGAVLAYASYGVALFAALLLAGWWTARHSGPRAMAGALWAGAATVLAVALNQPIIAAAGQARPYTAHPEILVLARRSADLSFPSDHAVMAGAVAAGLWLVSRRLGFTATVAALLMAFARVYVGVHYPRDVLAGLALGAAVALGGWALLRGPLTALVVRAERTPLRPLLRSLCGCRPMWREELDAHAGSVRVDALTR